MSAKMRQEVERKIVKAVVDSAIKAGYYIDVDDGEETVLKSSRDADAVLAAMFTTDEDKLYLSHKPNDVSFEGWVYFIYGNDGYDVIHDYTVNLEPIMKEANAIADHYGS